MIARDGAHTAARINHFARRPCGRRAPRSSRAAEEHHMIAVPRMRCRGARPGPPGPERPCHGRGSAARPARPHWGLESAVGAGRSVACRAGRATGRRRLVHGIEPGPGLLADPRSASRRAVRRRRAVAGERCATRPRPALPASSTVSTTRGSPIPHASQSSLSATAQLTGGRSSSSAGWSSSASSIERRTGVPSLVAAVFLARMVRLHVP
jgi:hypothetical protein